MTTTPDTINPEPLSRKLGQLDETLERAVREFSASMGATSLGDADADTGVSEDVLPPYETLVPPQSYADSVMAELDRAKCNAEAAITFYQQQRDTAAKRYHDEVTELDDRIHALRRAMGYHGFTRKSAQEAGLKGGPARARALSAEERRTIGSMGGRAAAAARAAGGARPWHTRNGGTPIWQRVIAAVHVGGPTRVTQLSKQLGIHYASISDAVRRYPEALAIRKGKNGAVVHAKPAPATGAAGG